MTASIVINKLALATGFLAQTNWNIVAACAATTAAIAAVITAGIIVWQTRYTLRIQTLNQLLASWQSPPMFPQMRHQSAEKILVALHKANIRHAATLSAKKGGVPIDLQLDKAPHIDSVLDFFETVALFVKKGVLDFEFAYHTFSWPMGCYWLLLESYVCATQKNEDDEVWQEFAALMPRFIQRTKGRITIEHAQKFLEDEQSLAID